MNFRKLLLYAAAGLAGWWGTGLCVGERGSHDAHGTHVVPQLSALHAIQRPGAGSGELSRLAALMGGIPEEGLSEACTRIESWPPGTARAFALAMLEARNSPADSPGDAFAPAGEEPDPPANRYRDLAEEMAEGSIGNCSSPNTRWGDTTLSDWVSADPAAATAAILKMPPGTRSAAVDIAAEAMAKYDPAAAVEFFLKSGEPCPGTGTAEAWAKFVIQNPAVEGTPDTPRRALDRMTLAQQNTLFAALAASVPNRGYVELTSDYDDANASDRDPLHRSDLALLARGVLQAKVSTPGMETFMRNLTQFPRVAEEALTWLHSLPSRTPAQETANEILLAGNESAVEVVARMAVMQVDFAFGPSDAEVNQTVLDRAAPSLLPSLAASGRLSTAVELLDHISNPDARRTSLEAILPAWMDADPAAARAAFNAAPLTVLERERWARHPAFLLHPEP